MTLHDLNIDLGACIAFASRFHVVGVQLPDRLLRRADEITATLSPYTQCVLLADSPQAQCCVDYVAAARYSPVEAIIYFGEPCLTDTHRDSLPTHFALEHRDVDPQVIAEVLQDAKATVIFHHPGFHKSLLDQAHLLAENTVIPALKIDSELKQGADETQIGPFIVSKHFLSSEKMQFAYIGNKEDSYYAFLLMNLGHELIYIDDTTWSRLPQTQNISRKLMRRYYLIEKTKDAQVIGIIASSLTLNKHLEIIRTVKQHIKESGKQSLLLLIGLINEPKLANFMEVDIFVNIGCPFSCLIDTFDYVKDVITPFELEIALGNCEWTGEYSTDPNVVLNSDFDMKEDNNEGSSEDSPRYSLIGRKLMSKSTVDNYSNQGMQVIEHQARTFEGLDPRIGETETAIIRPGMKGIAREYTQIEE